MLQDEVSQLTKFREPVQRLTIKVPSSAAARITFLNPLGTPREPSSLDKGFHLFGCRAKWFFAEDALSSGTHFARRRNIHAF